MRWLCLVALAGCYHPKIQNADFLCGPDSLCPSGFTCLAQHCYSTSYKPDLSAQAFHGNCMLGDLDLSIIFNGAAGSVTMNTETGEIDAFIGGDMSGSMVLVSPGPQAGFMRVNQPARASGPVGPAVALWNFQSFLVPKDVSIGPSPQSKAVMAVAACGDIDMKGAIDWSGYGAIGGGASLAGNVRFVPDELIDRMGGGGGGSDGSGGGGGGYGDAGTMGQGATGGAGGVSYGTETVTPVHMGSGGGGGGPSLGGIGGNGGGAVALLAGKVTIGGTINVSGIDGADAAPGAAAAGGGGGGSGGSILISGDSVVLATGHSLSSRGGIGGMGVAGGGRGGAGGAGRIWIGSDGAANLSVAGTLVSDPTPNESATPVDNFPR